MSPPYIKPVACTKLVNADGRKITHCGTITLTVTMGLFSTKYFFIVDHLLIPAILGCDFRSEHRFVLNFKSGIYYRAESPNQALRLCVTEQRSCSTFTIDEVGPQTIPVKCNSKNQIQSEMPTDIYPKLRSVVQEFEELFSKHLGQTIVTKHIIDTSRVAPSKVPPR